MAQYKKGDLIVDEKDVGVKDAADWKDQGFSLYEEPTSTASPPEPPITTNEPITTDQITNIGQTEEIFGESKRQADVYIPNEEALIKYRESGLKDTDIRRENEKMYIRSDSEFYKTQMPPRELAEAPTPIEPAEEPKKLTALEEKEQLAQSYLTDKTAYREEAREEAGVSEAQKIMNEGIEKANKLMDEIEKMKADKDLQNILNVEELDELRERLEGKPIPGVFIKRELTRKTAEITREQRLDELMDIYKLNTTINQYNSQLRTNQLLQGNYTAALDTYKTMMTDYAELKAIEFDILEDKGQLEKDERERLESEVAYEQALALEKGLVHISSTEEYNSIVKEMGVTADTFNNFFYKDPTNDKIYLRTGGGDEYLSVSEATTLGVPYGTTVKQAMNMGITPARWKGTDGAKTETGDYPKGFWSSIKTSTTSLQKGEKWGTVFDRIKMQYPDVSNIDIDRALGVEWRKEGAFEEWKQKQYKETQPRVFEIESGVWQWLASAEAQAMDSEQIKQEIMAAGFNPEDFGIY